MSAAKRFFEWFTSARIAVIFHTSQLMVWAVMVPLSVVTGWVFSIVFVSLVSIWTAALTHWGGLQAALADLRTPDE